MEEIVKWLQEIEQTASDLYRDASVFFEEDKEFAHFLGALAEDEAYHVDVIVKAAEYFRDATDKRPPFITLDSGTKEKIQRPLRENRERLLAGHLRKKDMIGCIVTNEFSEWNSIFLYVVNTLRDSYRQFEDVAAKIQQHKQRIETFLELLPDGRKYLEEIRRIPSVWRERILIVEDNAAILELFSTILASEGIVETAENGKEGLSKAGEHYFDVIISDVGMPVMSGIEFYEQAAKTDPSIGERFLFFTGFSADESIDFFTKNKLQYMVKPVPLDKIKQAVRDIMKRNSGHP